MIYVSVGCVNHGLIKKNEKPGHKIRGKYRRYLPRVPRALIRAYHLAALNGALIKYEK